MELLLLGGVRHLEQLVRVQLPTPMNLFGSKLLLTNPRD